MPKLTLQHILEAKKLMEQDIPPAGTPYKFTLTQEQFDALPDSMIVELARHQGLIKREDYYANHG